MTTKEFEELEDVIVAMRMGVAQPEFDFLLENFKKSITRFEDYTIIKFTQWMRKQNDLYEKLTKDPLKKK